MAVQTLAQVVLHRFRGVLRHGPILPGAAAARHDRWLWRVGGDGGGGGDRFAGPRAAGADGGLGQVRVRAVLRARVVLAAADGLANGAIAREFEVSVNTVRKWRGRFAALGPDGWRDAERSGRPKIYGPEVRVAIVATETSMPPPPGSDLVPPGCPQHVADACYVSASTSQVVRIAKHGDFPCKVIRMSAGLEAARYAAEAGGRRTYYSRRGVGSSLVADGAAARDAGVGGRWCSGSNDDHGGAVVRDV
ncbi:helix-turn-helix domain-containing protein [Actinomadura sp. NPDC049753]|uniref:helix-turn-helix domain-containing protein n=1 Tax=Actinomadura sp. NPDC049753 TaxID=3154739 RepID=UPI00342E86BF